MCDSSFRLNRVIIKIARKLSRKETVSAVVRLQIKLVTCLIVLLKVTDIEFQRNG